MHVLPTLWRYHWNVLDKVKHLYSDFTNIAFSNIDVVSDILILIRAGNPMLRIYVDISVENENEPVALKTKIVWVIFGECQNTNKYPNITCFLRHLTPTTLFQSFDK